MIDEPVRVHRRVPPAFLLFCVVAVLYAIGAQAAWSLFGAADIGMSFFPPAGVTVAALVMLPRRRWPAILAAVVVAETAVDMSNGLTLPISLGYALANSTEPLVGALAVRALATRLGTRVDLSRRTGMFVFVTGAVLIGPIVGGMVGSTVRLIDAGDDLLPNVVHWAIGDGLGILAIGAPIVVCWRLDVRRTFARTPEPIGLLVATSVAAVAAFWIDAIPTYVILPALTVVALRLAVVGVAAAGAIVAILANLATASGHGPFDNVIGITASGQLAQTQILVAVSLLAAWMLAIGIHEREILRVRAAVERDARLRAESMEAVGTMSAELASVATSDDVFDRFRSHVVGKLGVSVVAVNELHRSSGMLRLRTAAFPDAGRLWPADVSIESPLPGPTAARTATASFFETSEQLVERFPEGRLLLDSMHVGALAFLPMSEIPRGAGFIGLAWPAPRAFEPNDRTYLRAIARVTGLALERSRLLDQAAAAADDAAFLARLGDSLDRETSVDRRAERLIELMLERGHRYGAVLVGDDPQSLRLVAAGHPPNERPPREDGVFAIAREAFTRQETTFIDSTDSSGTTLAATPLLARGRVLGVLGVAATSEPAVVERGLREAASRAAVALDNALLYEAERHASHTLQLGLLGGSLPAIRDVEIAAAYKPGTATLEVGGDWYDAFTLPDGSLALVVGDVVGHGLEAAVAMGQLRGAVRGLATDSTPAQLIDRLDAFVETLPLASMATLAFAAVDPASGSFRYACAGHPPPIVIDHAGGGAAFVWDGRSGPLGTSLGGPRVDATHQLDEGDVLLLYTDGLVESRGEAIDAGLERLVAVAAERSDAATARLVDDVAEAMLAGRHQDDDVCILALRRATAELRATFRLRASPSELAGLRRDLDAWLGELALPDDDRRSVVLGVSEAVTNSIEHAYRRDGRGIVTVETEIDATGQLRIVVRDEGTWRRPRVDALRGRGERVMRGVMDDVSVQPARHGTIVEMRRSTMQRMGA